MRGWFGLFWVLLLLPEPAYGQESLVEEHIHVSIQSGPAAFSAVLYGVRRLKSAAVAVQMKEYPISFVRQNRTAFVEGGEFDRLMSEVRALGALSLPDEVTNAPLEVVYRVDIASGGERHSFVVGGPGLSDGPQGQVVEKVRAFVEAATGVIPFRDLAIPVRHLGVLNVRSQPRCQVTADGVNLGITTPVYNLDFPEGEHEVELKCPSNGASRRLRFKILREEIRDINVDLTQ